MEYHAGLRNRASVPQHVCKGTLRGDLNGTLEIAFNHYAGRTGASLPETASVSAATTARTESGDQRLPAELFRSDDDHARSQTTWICRCEAYRTEGIECAILQESQRWASNPKPNASDPGVCLRYPLARKKQYLSPARNNIYLRPRHSTPSESITYPGSAYQ